MQAPPSLSSKPMRGHFLTLSNVGGQTLVPTWDSQMRPFSQSKSSLCVQNRTEEAFVARRCDSDLNAFIAAAADSNQWKLGGRQWLCINAWCRDESSAQRRLRRASPLISAFVIVVTLTNSRPNDWDFESRSGSLRESLSIADQTAPFALWARSTSVFAFGRLFPRRQEPHQPLQLTEGLLFAGSQVL